MPDLRAAPPGTTITQRPGGTTNAEIDELIAQFGEDPRLRTNTYTTVDSAGVFWRAPPTYQWIPISPTQLTIVPEGGVAGVPIGQLIPTLQRGGTGDRLVNQIPALVRSGRLTSVVRAQLASGHTDPNFRQILSLARPVLSAIGLATGQPEITLLGQLAGAAGPFAGANGNDNAAELAELGTPILEAMAHDIPSAGDALSQLAAAREILAGRDIYRAPTAQQDDEETAITPISYDEPINADGLEVTADEFAEARGRILGGDTYGAPEPTDEEIRQEIEAARQEAAPEPPQRKERLPRTGARREKLLDQDLSNAMAIRRLLEIEKDTPELGRQLNTAIPGAGRLLKNFLAGRATSGGLQTLMLALLIRQLQPEQKRRPYTGPPTRTTPKPLRRRRKRPGGELESWMRSSSRSTST